MMFKHGLKRVFVALFALLMIFAVLSGCMLFNQKTITITKVINVSLHVNQTKNISVTTTPNDVIIKAVSNNPSVATVTVNKNILTIKGKAVGEAEITITATKSGNKTASLKFNVIVSKLPSQSNIVNVSLLADIEVAYRTLFENIGLPDKVEVTLDDQTKQTLEVEWSEGNYDGSSTGTYKLEGTLILVEGITNNNHLKAKIDVIVPVAAKGDVKSVEMLAAKKVSYETDFLDLDLPKQAKVTLDEDSETYLDVEWISGNYDGNLAGEVYYLEGNLVLCTGITNTLNLNVTIEITVNNPPEIISFTPEGGIYRINEGLNILLSADDADGDDLIYRWKDNEEEFLVRDNNNFWHYLLDKNPHEVVVRVSDGLDEIEEKRTYEVNGYPEITSFTASEKVIKIDEEITLEVVAVDHENDDLTYRWGDNYGTIDGEECSSLTLDFPGFGTHLVWVSVSDDGGENEVCAYIEIIVVENYIPEIKKITGPESVLVNQEGIIFTAEYDHRDTTKELTTHWETIDGKIIEGQNTNQIKWNPPAVGGDCRLTFVVDDGVTEVKKDIHVFVEEPNIRIECNETIGAGQNCEMFIFVDIMFDAEINILVTPSDGEIVSSFHRNCSASYNWVAPKELVTTTFSIDVTIDGVKFDRDWTINVVENNTPIVNDILVNNEPIKSDDFLILNPNEEYNFKIDVIDPDEDNLDIQWAFYKVSGDYNLVGFEGDQANYISNERSVVTCQIEVEDGINDAVYASINMIFDDGSVSELPDQTKVEKIDEIIEACNQVFEQCEIGLIVDHIHPDAELHIRPIFEEYLNNQIGFYVKERDFIVLDAFLERYITVILFEMDYVYNGCHIVRDNLMGMVFQQDEAGVIKLYGLDI